MNSKTTPRIANALNALSALVQGNRLYLQILWIWFFLTVLVASVAVFGAAFIFWQPPDYRFWDWPSMFRAGLLLDAVVCGLWVRMTLRTL